MAEYYIGNIMVDADNAYLEHYGILGQKWGLRRFRNKDGTLTSEGKIRYGNGDTKGTVTKAAEKVKKATSKTKEKVKSSQNKEKPEPKKGTEAYEKKKQEALKSGTAADVLKYQGDLTNKELQEAYQRLNYENLISDLNKKNQPVPTSAKIGKGVKDAITFINSSANLIDSINKLKTFKVEIGRPKQSSIYAEDAYTDILKDFADRYRSDPNATIDFSKVRQVYTNANDLANLEKMIGRK